jgi:hypothetical protein
MCPMLPQVEAWKVASGRLLWWPDDRLLRWWSRSTVELLLLLWLLRLELPRLILWVIALILLLLWSTQLTPKWGIHHAVYRRAPLELPLLADVGIIFFLFFSSTTAIAFINLS